VAKQTAPARNAYSLPPKDRNKSGDLITRYRITGPDRLNSIATDHTSQLGIYLAIGNLRIKPLLSSRLNVLRSLPQGPIDIDQETKVINGPRALYIPTPTTTTFSLPRNTFLEPRTTTTTLQQINNQHVPTTTSRISTGNSGNRRTDEYRPDNLLPHQTDRSRSRSCREYQTETRTIMVSSHSRSDAQTPPIVWTIARSTFSTYR
jgi:hypothetical protein